ncbi:hypothetical protein DQ04_13461010 [Trypanosoma grayi]|uniref:hypothetical protein n=1 Tax=Trypanosoma grayi TaxID=71804 RepID=UPI0004F46669|nr:hypothetical protein DQ04_13461010 [Trypanosoma grayi]KEG06533.1 hypothetical protein DQ04_13461010 [Trypanosoma grayi]
MYGGPWQEYKLMKVIEHLREENERLRRDAAGDGVDFAISTPIWGADAGKGSSHHFPTSVDDAPLGDALIGSTRSSFGETTPSAPSSVPRSRNTKPSTALRFMTTVRDVDVFVEQEEAQQSRLNSTALEVRNSVGVSGTGRKRPTGPPETTKCEHKSQRRPLSALQSSASGAARAVPVRVELGTGKVLRESSVQVVVPSPQIDEGSGVTPSGVVCLSILQEDPLLKELLCGPPLDTKSKYQRAGQPLPERRPPKNSKGGGISEEELQERIERRLRLQMLYSGQSVPDGEAPLSIVEPLQKEEQQQQGDDKAVAFIGQPCPSVPWDVLPPTIPYPQTADGTARSMCLSVAFTSDNGEQGRSPNVSSPPQRRQRLSHPYDVGAPLAPPNVEPSSRCGATTEAPLGTSALANAGYDVPRRSSNGGICRTFNRDSLSLTTNVFHSGHFSPSSALPPAELSDSGAGATRTAGSFTSYPTTRVSATRASTVEPLDDDTVGALLNWAEHLDADAII